MRIASCSIKVFVCMLVLSLSYSVQAGINSELVKKAPIGIAILALLGPGLVWTSDMVGSGEVILTTRNGAILGTGVLWAVLIGIFLKCWIGISGPKTTHYR